MVKILEKQKIYANISKEQKNGEKKTMIKKEIKKLIVASIFATLFIVTIIVAGTQFLNKPKDPNPPEIKTWNVPIYMQENLRFMIEDFNRRFDERIKFYRDELRKHYGEFKNMPDDVVFDLENGYFIGRDDFLKLKQQQEGVQEK